MRLSFIENQKPVRRITNNQHFDYFTEYRRKDEMCMVLHPEPKQSLRSESTTITIWGPQKIFPEHLTYAAHFANNQRSYKQKKGELKKMYSEVDEEFLYSNEAKVRIRFAPVVSPCYKGHPMPVPYNKYSPIMGVAENWVSHRRKCSRIQNLKITNSKWV